MRRSTLAVLALFTATVALALADQMFVARALASYPNVWAALNNAVTGAEAIVFGAIGALIVTRRGNAVGWLLSAMGLVVAILAASASYGQTLSPSPSAALAAEPLWQAPWWAIAGNFGWLVALTLLGALLQIFPDGRPLSPRWRPLLGLTIAWPVWFLVVTTFSPETVFEGQRIPNPYGLTGPIGGVLLALEDALFPLTIAGAAAAVASVLLRFRRSTGRQRAQLKWFAYGAALALASGAVTDAIKPNDAAMLVNGVFISILPLCVAAAILRQGLYDIDVVIERTLVYGATTAAIGVAFFAGIVVLQAALRPLTSGSELAVAASTLGSFALFQPLRRRMQQAVDRRFYRSRYDAARTLDQFSERLRDEVDLDAVRRDLLDAARRTVQPTHASVWLREPVR